MKIHEFPYVFERSARNDLQRAISTRQSQSASRINNLDKSKKGEPAKVGLSACATIGVIGGFISCTCVTCSNESQSDGFLYGFITLFIWITIACVLGALIDSALYKAWIEELNNIDNQITVESNNRDKYIEDETRECDNKCRKYAEAFEKSAQEMSVQYAASSLAQGVISWMTDGFCRTIDAADRRPHIESVNVPFVFDVYPNKITCNLGTFDFELQRCRNLNSPLEQAALARAIASSVQLNVMKKYPQDVTGSPVDVSISFSYAQDRPIVTISYGAQNFNYKPVADWEDVGK